MGKAQPKDGVPDFLLGELSYARNCCLASCLVGHLFPIILLTDARRWVASTCACKVITESRQ